VAGSQGEHQLPTPCHPITPSGIVKLPSPLVEYDPGEPTEVVTHMTQDGFAYAVHALVILAKSPGSATSSFLAGSVNIHATCLRKVMAPLARAGLVHACQGREGGYRLARPAAEMSLAEIYEAVVSEPLLRPNPAAVNPRCPISVAMGPALAAIAADAEARFRKHWHDGAWQTWRTRSRSSPRHQPLCHPRARGLICWSSRPRLGNLWRDSGGIEEFLASAGPGARSVDDVVWTRLREPLQDSIRRAVQLLTVAPALLVQGPVRRLPA
jgi:Rrf2 family protein